MADSADRQVTNFSGTSTAGIGASERNCCIKDLARSSTSLCKGGPGPSMAAMALGADGSKGGPGWAGRLSWSLLVGGFNPSQKILVKLDHFPEWASKKNV